MKSNEVKELKELLDLLEAAGVNAMLCDTPVHQSSVPVKCGYPVEIGDDDLSEYFMLPKTLLGMYPEIMIPVSGESMRDIGYEPGDLLRVRLGASVHDNDSVLALLDGKATVKSFFTDVDGLKWLVPQNEEFDAILLTDDMDIRFLGVVVGVTKDSPRPSSRDLQRAVRRTKDKDKSARKLSKEEVNSMLIKIGSEVRHARQWFAVYRIMVDRKVQDQNDIAGFVERVKMVLPDHEHLPVAKELARMDVQSFSKPVSLWVADNAPVGGTRFKDYLRIAMLMGSYLAGEE